VTPTHVRTTALCAVSAQFMYHFTYDFRGFGGTRRRRAMLLKAWRADMVDASGLVMMGGCQLGGGGNLVMGLRYVDAMKLSIGVN
jgi:hypothetical protein